MKNQNEDSFVRRLNTRRDASFLELSVSRHLLLRSGGLRLDLEFPTVGDDDVLLGAVVPALGDVL